MPKITFTQDGLEQDVESGSPAIDAAKASGSSIPFGCTNGLCGTCISKVTSGKENLSPMEDKEKQTLEMFGADDGEHRLVCQCKVNGDVTIDSP